MSRIEYVEPVAEAFLAWLTVVEADGQSSKRSKPLSNRQNVNPEGEERTRTVVGYNIYTIME